MYFHDPESRPRKELLPGIITRTFWGDQMLISLVEVQPQAGVPSHSHPHEQLGYVVKGELTMNVNGESKALKAGDIYVVPGGVQHEVSRCDDGATLFEVFSPVREEYKY